MSAVRVVSLPHLFVKMRGPPGGGDELLEPRLLHSERGLDIEEDDGPQHVKRSSRLRGQQ